MQGNILHKPVLVNEVIRFLNLKDGLTILDATVGCAGHANFILDKIKPEGTLIGIDRDETSLNIARERLKDSSKNIRLVHANFRDIDKVLKNLGIEKLDGAVFDLGISSYQIDDPGRGFSFAKEGILDMRMDLSEDVRAYDIVNRCKKEELERIIRDFGEERFSKRISGAIVERRKLSPINTTKELSDIISKAVGRRYRSQKINPATRTFQAIRIAVNEELKSIDEALSKVIGVLNNDSRVCVISYHSPTIQSINCHITPPLL